MTLRTFSHDAIDAQCTKRPIDYRAQLMQAAVRSDAGGVTFDTSHPAWVTLRRRFQSRPRPKVKQAVSLSRAVLVGKYVSSEVQAARLAACGRCDQLRTDEHGNWCGACGCGLAGDARRVVNLAAYEEHLPHWGCKHPRREEGAGWAR